MKIQLKRYGFVRKYRPVVISSASRYEDRGFEIAKGIRLVINIAELSLQPKCIFVCTIYKMRKVESTHESVNQKFRLHFTTRRVRFENSAFQTNRIVL